MAPPGGTAPVYSDKKNPRPLKKLTLYNKPAEPEQKPEEKPEEQEAAAATADGAQDQIQQMLAARRAAPKPKQKLTMADFRKGTMKATSTAGNAAHPSQDGPSEAGSSPAAALAGTLRDHETPLSEPPQIKRPQLVYEAGPTGPAPIKPTPVSVNRSVQATRTVGPRPMHQRPGAKRAPKKGKKHNIERRNEPYWKASYDFLKNADIPAFRDQEKPLIVDKHFEDYLFRAANGLLDRKPDPFASNIATSDVEMSEDDQAHRRRWNSSAYGATPVNQPTPTAWKSFGEKYLSKYHWKGSGIGATEQGMAEPLAALAPSRGFSQAKQAKKKDESTENEHEDSKVVKIEGFLVGIDLDQEELGDLLQRIDKALAKHGKIEHIKLAEQTVFMKFQDDMSVKSVIEACKQGALVFEGKIATACAQYDPKLFAENLLK